MMPRAITTNHRAGTTFETIAAARGMLSIGKMKPESSIVGSIVPISAPIIATRCDDVRAEMSMPSESDTRMKSSAFGEQQRDAAAQRHAEDQARLDDHAAGR